MTDLADLANFDEGKPLIYPNRPVSLSRATIACRTSSLGGNPEFRRALAGLGHGAVLVSLVQARNAKAVAFAPGLRVNAMHLKTPKTKRGTLDTFGMYHHLSVGEMWIP